MYSNFDVQSNFVGNSDQMQTISQVPVITTAPTIQNTIQPYSQPQIVYAQPQIAQQRQINQTNGFEQQPQRQTFAQTNTQQVSGTLSEIDKQIRENAQRKISDIYTGQQKAEAEKEKEFERLKEENERFKKEEEARKQKEENDKKLEDERSEIKNKEKELDEREDFLQSMEHNSQIDKEDLDIATN